MDVQTDVVRQMAAAFTAGALGVDPFLRGACQLIRDRLRCDRVSVWRFEGPAGLRTLHCVLTLPAASRHEESIVPDLTEAEYRGYHAALTRAGFVVSADVQADERLTGLWPRYLAPRKIRALLDVGFSVNGRTVGVLCCEQVTGPRDWLPAEVASVRRACTTISLALTKSGEWERHFPEDMPVTRS